MKKFINLFKQDVLLIIRSGLHYAVIFISLIFIILINFVIPGELELKSTELFFDNTAGKMLEPYLAAGGVEKDRIFSNYDDFIKALKEDKDSIGIMAEGSAGDARFTIFSQGTISEENINLAKASIASLLEKISGSTGQAGYRIETLREDTGPVPFNKNLVPVFLTYEVVALGFILIAVMIFQEKTDGSIRSYSVSSAGTGIYILSKVSIFTLMAVLYGLITTVATAGFNIDYAVLVSLIILAGIFMTLVGLLVSVFFNNISEFLFVALGILLIMQLPTISYLNPTFSPSFIKWFPMYPVLFGFREALFPAGRENYLYPFVLVLIASIVVLYALCYFFVNKKLMRSGS